jgi:hypothetical protein
MGFWDGFGEGFAGGYQQSFDAAERRKLFMEETAKKRSENVGRVLPSIFNARAELEQTGVKMDYVESRGLNPKLLYNVYSDPEALEEVYQILRTEGADWDTETVASFIRASGSSKEPEVSWRDHYQRSLSVFQDLDFETLNPETVPAMISSTRPSPTGVVEVLPRTKTGDAGYTAEMQRRFELQENVFDTQVLELARKEIARLDLARAQGALDREGEERLAVLRRDADTYSTNPNSKLALRQAYEPFVYEALESNTGIQPEALIGLNENPLLFRINPQGQRELALSSPEELPRPTTREERDALPSGTEYLDPYGVRRIKS